MIDTAWIITETELAPRLLEAESGGRRAAVPTLFKQVRGHRMAKAALENAVWDLEAQMERVPLAKLLGGTRKVIPCGVSIGIQPSLEQLMDKIATELAAGYQRIKLKCKPGWDNQHLRSGARALARHHAELRCQLRLSHEGPRPHRQRGTSSSC